MEMLPEVIAQYFDELRRLVKKNNVFFCCNRAEKTNYRSIDEKFDRVFSFLKMLITHHQVVML